MSGNRRVIGVFMLALGFSLGTEPAHGVGERILSFGIGPITPSFPLSSTPIRVEVGGTFADSCFEICDVQGEWLSPFEFQLDWYVRDTSMTPDGICYGVVITLSSALELGLLEPGDYLASATLYVVDWDGACAEGTPVRDDDVQFIIFPDCNANGTIDWADIVAGTSEDCNGNGIPDECEPDCNDNTVADGCDIAAGTSEDCNGNGIPDECDIAAGTSLDVNDNGVPDECEAEVPTLSDWGVVVMGLLLLSAARVYFRRQGEARPELKRRQDDFPVPEESS